MRNFVTLVVMTFLFFSNGVASSAAQDVWRFQRSLSPEWPQLSSSECDDYGSRYRYSECGMARERRAPLSVVTSTPRPAAPRTVSGHQNAASSAKIVQRPHPFKPDANATCAANMKSCFSQCTAAALTAMSCNEQCATQTQCGARLSLTYFQFIEMQSELSEFLQRRDGVETRVAGSSHD